MSLNEKQYAALAGTLIFWDCLTDQRTWQCTHCGYAGNWIASEVCERCGVEDCSQGLGVVEGDG